MVVVLAIAFLLNFIFVANISLNSSKMRIHVKHILFFFNGMLNTYLNDEFGFLNDLPSGCPAIIATYLAKR